MKDKLGIAADLLKGSIEFLCGQIQSLSETLENSRNERDQAILNFSQTALAQKVKVNHESGTNIPLPAEIRKDSILVRIFGSGEIASLLGSFFLLIFIGTQWLETDLVYIVLLSLAIFLVITYYLPAGVAAFMDFFEILSEIPESRRKIYYILLIAALMIGIGFILFYSTRQNADSEGFYYYAYQASYVLWEIGSAIAAAALKMLKIYHRWSLEYSAAYKTNDALYKKTEMALLNTIAEMTDEYEKFLSLPDPKPSLTIGFGIREGMESVIESRKRKGGKNNGPSTDDILKLLK
jgi:hypothetical protein